MIQISQKMSHYLISLQKLKKRFLNAIIIDALFVVVVDKMELKYALIISDQRIKVAIIP